MKVSFFILTVWISQFMAFSRNKTGSSLRQTKGWLRRKTWRRTTTTTETATIHSFIQMNRSLRTEAGDGSFLSLHSSAQVCNIRVRLHQTNVNAKAKIFWTWYRFSVCFRHRFFCLLSLTCELVLSDASHQTKIFYFEKKTNKIECITVTLNRISKDKWKLKMCFFD